jgi:hypothetical protein
MQLRRAALAILLALAATGPAKAQLCALVLLGGGVLGLSQDGTILGSEEGIGHGATITVASVLGNHVVTVGAPTRVSSPPGYDPGPETVQVAYRGTGVLSSVVHPYGTGASQFAVNGVVAATLVNLHNRIVNPEGFAEGGYTTRTVVTCS